MAVLAVARWLPPPDNPSATEKPANPVLVTAPHPNGEAEYVLIAESGEPGRPPLLAHRIAAGQLVGFEADGNSLLAVAGAERHPLSAGQYAWFRDERSRSDAMSRAQERLRLIARAIAAQLSRARSDSEFIESLCQEFWARILAADRKGQVCTSVPGKLAGYARTTLKRLHLDAIDNDIREGGGAGAGPTDQADLLRAVPTRWLADFLTSGRPLPEQDLRVVQTWRPRDRLLLLTWVPFWLRVPRPTWERWCQEAGIPLPFPPKAFASAPHESRAVILAAALGMPTPNALSQDWCRKQHLFLDLPSLRDALLEP